MAALNSAIVLIQWLLSCCHHDVAYCLVWCLNYWLAIIILSFVGKKCNSSEVGSMRNNLIIKYLAASPGMWVAVNAWASHNAQHCPEQLLLTWLLIVVGVYKVYCSNIEYPIIRRHAPIRRSYYHRNSGLSRIGPIQLAPASYLNEPIRDEPISEYIPN